MHTCTPFPPQRFCKTDGLMESWNAMRAKLSWISFAFLLVLHSYTHIWPHLLATMMCNLLECVHSRPLTSINSNAKYVTEKYLWLCSGVSPLCWELPNWYFNWCVWKKNAWICVFILSCNYRISWNAFHVWACYMCQPKSAFLGHGHLYFFQELAISFALWGESSTLHQQRMETCSKWI